MKFIFASRLFRALFEEETAAGCAGSWAREHRGSALSAPFADERLRSASPARAAFTYFGISSQLRAA